MPNPVLSKKIITYTYIRIAVSRGRPVRGLLSHRWCSSQCPSSADRRLGGEYNKQQETESYLFEVTTVLRILLTWISIVEGWT